MAVVVDVDVFYTYIEGVYVEEPEVLVHTVVARGMGGISRVG